MKTLLIPLFASVALGQNFYIFASDVCQDDTQSFCDGGSLASDSIIRCMGPGTGTTSRCSDNLVAEPPAGVAEALCYQSSAEAGDAACAKNCVVYSVASVFTLDPSICTPQALDEFDGDRPDRPGPTRPGRPAEPGFGDERPSRGTTFAPPTPAPTGGGDDDDEDDDDVDGPTRTRGPRPTVDFGTGTGTGEGPRPTGDDDDDGDNDGDDDEGPGRPGGNGTLPTGGPGVTETDDGLSFPTEVEAGAGMIRTGGLLALLGLGALLFV